VYQVGINKGIILRCTVYQTSTCVDHFVQCLVLSCDLSQWNVLRSFGKILQYQILWKSVQ